MKKFLVYGKKSSGVVESFVCFAESEAQAENKILAVWEDLIKVEAFDYNIQFS